MRSLVLCADAPVVADQGGRIRSRMLIDALTQLGDVHVAAPPTPAVGELDFEMHALPHATARATAVGRKLGAWAHGRSDVLTRRWGPTAPAEVALLAARLQPDLIAADSSFVLPLLPPVPTPLLLQLHNIESALLGRRDGVARGWRERWARAVESRWIARAEGRCAARARLVITVSSVDRAHLLRLCPGATVEVIGNAVDLDQLPLLPSVRAFSPRLLFVGTFDYPPNVEAVEELVRRHLPPLAAKFRELGLDLVGRDDSGVISRLAVETAAVAHGRVADLLPYYRAASAVYLPIRSGGGTRIKVLEAFALGRPVLATAVAVEGLEVQPEKHYLQVEGPEQGVAALQRVLMGGATEIVANARALVEQRYSRRAAVDRMVELIPRHFGG